MSTRELIQVVVAGLLFGSPFILQIFLDRL
jgi:hypothetical protein